MVSAYIPFDEVVARCTEDVPGEFLDFSDETEGDISDRHVSESDGDVGEEESLPLSNSEESDVESHTSNGMFCVFISLSNTS